MDLFGDIFFLFYLIKGLESLKNEQNRFNQ